MTELIACLSTGKGTWGHIARLVEDQGFTKIFLLTNEFGMQNFKGKDNIELIQLNTTAPIKDLTQEIQEKLKGKLKEPEVHINFVSGSGSEHMALLSALLKMGVGIRLTAVNPEGKIEEV